ncbi:hypothetical protein BASA81_006864 [Batrachochytrium salamandrivorans]|nr:hypothetical protein BASA81_006864 [Batrachochytrium salamandrivorans]
MWNPMSASFAWVWAWLIKVMEYFTARHRLGQKPRDPQQEQLPAASKPPRQALQQDQEDANKLRKNISTKGTNSYYYAHKNTGEVSIVGNEPPKLLVTDTLTVVALGTSFDTFAWADSAKTVSVYIPFPQAETVLDSAVKITNGETGFSFTLEFESQKFFLTKPKLHGTISSASWKKKNGKFIIVLHKKETKVWHKLEQ